MTSGEPPTAPGPVIVCADLEKTYTLIPAIRDLNLTVDPGERVALFGPNGAGKTTLIRLLAGLLRPTGGRVGLWGRRPWGRTGGIVRARVGLLSHQSHLYEELSARENLRFYARLYGISYPAERVDEVLEEFGLRNRANDPVRTLSRGMAQRVALSRALIHRPALLLLDEPDTGLDIGAREALRQHLNGQRQGVTVVMATHAIELGVDLCDRAVVIDGGALTYDSAAPGQPALSADDLRSRLLIHLTGNEAR